MSAAHISRRDLEKAGDYVIRAKIGWFAVFPKKIEQCHSRSATRGRDDFNFVLYRLSENERDHHIVPYSLVRNVLTKPSLTRSKVNHSIRWNCTIKDGVFRVWHTKEFFDVSSSHGAPLITEIPAFKLPEEAFESVEFSEGARVTISVNRYERDGAARAACIARSGLRCFGCGLLMEERYGQIARGFIHVHHVKPLSFRKVVHSVNPELDLIPLCPNCHAVVHLADPPLSLEQLKRARPNDLLQ